MKTNLSKTDLNGSETVGNETIFQTTENEAVSGLSQIEPLGATGIMMTAGCPCINVTGITLSSSSLTLEVYQPSYLYATVLPSDATNKNVYWTSSNTSVADVNYISGLVSARAVGTVVITAMTADGGYTAKCNVTVNLKELSPDPIVVYKYKTVNVTAINGKNNNILCWGIDNSNLCLSNKTVEGVTVTGIEEGATKLTALPTSGATVISDVIVVTPYDKNVTNGSDRGYVNTTYLDVLSEPYIGNNNYISLETLTDARYMGTFGSVPIYLRDIVTILGSVSISGIKWLYISTTKGNIGFVQEGFIIKEILSTAVSLDKKSISLNISNNTRGIQQLTATVIPSNTTNNRILWRSDNSAVATVDDNGVVTAQGKGTATITATTDDTGKADTCTVTVVRLLDSIKIDPGNLGGGLGTPEHFSVTVSPSDANDKTILWSSSDSSIASISNASNSGATVTFNKAGLVTITAQNNASGLYDSCGIGFMGGGSYASGSGSYTLSNHKLTQEEIFAINDAADYYYPRQKSISNASGKWPNHSKAEDLTGEFIVATEEQYDNVGVVFSYLSDWKGWTDESICALLGNMQYESYLNPTQGQIGGSGYGLCQFTPGPHDFIGWANSYGFNTDSIIVQLEYLIFPIEYEPGSWSTNNSYGMSFSTFISTKMDKDYNITYEENKKNNIKKTPDYLAQTFLRCYERPKDPEYSATARCDNAEFWFYMWVIF